jgi:hypothetical protein
MSGAAADVYRKSQIISKLRIEARMREKHERENMAQMLHCTSHKYERRTLDLEY